MLNSYLLHLFSCSPSLICYYRILCWSLQPDRHHAVSGLFQQAFCARLSHWKRPPCCSWPLLKPALHIHSTTSCSDILWPLPFSRCQIAMSDWSTSQEQSLWLINRLDARHHGIANGWLTTAIAIFNTEKLINDHSVLDLSLWLYFTKSPKRRCSSDWITKLLKGTPLHRSANWNNTVCSPVSGMQYSGDI